jgi:glycosyltransferase involved in cell wall biosynthesis
VRRDHPAVERPCPLLFVDHADALGGAEHSLLLVCEHLDRTRWAPHLACTAGPLAQRAAALGVPVHLTPQPRLRRSPSALGDMGRGAGALARVARQTGAALIIANTVRSAIYTAPAALLARVPWVWYRRDFWLGEAAPRLPWVDALGKAALIASSIRVIANSEATRRHHPLQQSIVVVPNGIQVGRYNPRMDGAPFRAAYGIPARAPLLGMVGRLSVWKGQERFLRVMARVLAEIPAAWGVVVGGPIFGEHAYQAALHRAAQEQSIAERVVFTGQLDDPRAALAAMDLFVHPGDPEAFGLVNVEAMAMGKPIVAFSHGALPEIVLDGGTGLLVPPGDEAAMARAAVALLADGERRARMGLAGRQRAVEHFTIERTVGALETVLAALIDRDGGGREPGR